MKNNKNIDISHFNIKMLEFLQYLYFNIEDLPHERKLKITVGTMNLSSLRKIFNFGEVLVGDIMIPIVPSPTEIKDQFINVNIEGFFSLNIVFDEDDKFTFKIEKINDKKGN